jgi:hypothetical protein
MKQQQNPIDMTGPTTHFILFGYECVDCGEIQSEEERQFVTGSESVAKERFTSQYQKIAGSIEGELVTIDQTPGLVFESPYTASAIWFELPGLAEATVEAAIAYLNKMCIVDEDPGLQLREFMRDFLHSEYRPYPKMPGLIGGDFDALDQILTNFAEGEFV